MSRNADLLYAYISGDHDEKYLTSSVIADYVGNCAHDDCPEDVGPYGKMPWRNIVLEIYVGLYHRFRVSANMLHAAYIAGKLDEFIHSRYATIVGNRGGYYPLFVKYNKSIGALTCINPIPQATTSVDVCPSCGRDGFTTVNAITGLTPDCEKCFKFCCKQCIGSINYEEGNYLCIDCARS